MRKEKKRDPLLRICIYAFCTLAALMLLSRVLDSADNLVLQVKGFVGWLANLMMPFIIGVLLAYLMRPLVNVLERRVFRRFKRRRGLSILVGYTLVIVALGLFVLVALPSIGQSIRDLVAVLPGYVNQMTEFVQTELADNPYLNQPQIRAMVEQIGQSLLNFAGTTLQRIAGNAINTVISTVQGVFSFFITIIISIYILLERKELLHGFKRVFFAVNGKVRGRRWGGYLREADTVLAQYVSARVLDAIVVGVLAYLGMLVLKVKYAPLLGAWYGLSNTIPFLGPFLGGIPAVLVTAFDSPLKALYLGIYIIVMQQIDAWFIDPMITSNRLQISPLWVLLGVTVGGGFFGVWGMFLGAPAFAVALLTVRRFVQRRDRQQAQDERQLAQLGRDGGAASSEAAQAPPPGDAPAPAAEDGAPARETETEKT
ncbi:MAG: AI-2E family transporter [Christensenellales bacterium]|jgi:predicted PurR-regulated permease PerM